MSRVNNLAKIKYIFPAIVVILVVFFVVGIKNVHAANVNFTVSAWVKVASSTAASQAVAVKDNEIRLVTDGSGKVACQIHNGTSWQAGATSSEAISLNQWYYTVCTYDGVNIKVYLDSIEKASLAETNDVANTTNVWQFGNDASGTYNDFQGFLDEVKIYPYARTAAEIKQDYVAGLAGIKSKHGISAAFGSVSEKWMSDGLVGYWTLDETATTSGAYDSSGNGNTGTFYGHASTTGAKFGNGGVFDGSGDYVDLTSVITMPNDWAVAWWSNLNWTSGDTQYAIVGEFDDVANNIRFRPEYDLLYWGDKINATAAFSGVTGQTGWHHWVIIKNGSDYSLYKDGNLHSIVNQPGLESWDGDRAHRIGAVSGQDYFDGLIDEVRIYNRALSADEVRKLYEWAPGPVAHWKFDEKTGTTAYDTAASTTFSGGNHGTLTCDGSGCGMPIWSEGKYGGALKFDGSDDYVELLHNPPLNIVGPITLAAWIKTSATGTEDLIIDGAGPAPLFPGYMFIMCGNSGGVLGYHVDGYPPTAYSNTAVNDGIWHHVTVVVSGTTVYFYKDGIPDGSPTGFQEPNSYEYTRKIGMGDYDYGDSYFNGLIDDVRIYNYVLSQKQIINVMNGRKVWENAVGSPVGSEVLYLKFDEGYGATAYDSSPQGNNGTLHHGGTGGNTSTSSMWDLAGKFGRAIEFDGSGDYVDAGTPSDLNISQQDHSVSLWVNLDAWDNGSYYSRLLFNKIDANDGYFLTAGTAGPYYDDEINYCVYDEGNRIEVEAINLNLNTWYHCVGVYDSSAQSITLYINGIAYITTDTSDATLGDGSNGVNIGRRTDGYGYTDGLIDDVRIYNFALNADEIKLIYNQGKSAVMGSVSMATTTTAGVYEPSWSKYQEYCIPGDTATCLPPVLEIKMDEKTGTTTYDTSGQGNDGNFVSVASSPTWKGAGYCKYGSCLEFDGGDDWISNNAIIPGLTFSFSFWIKSGALVNTKEMIGNSGCYCGVNEDNDDHKIACTVDGETSGGARSTTSVDDNEWHHIVFTSTANSQSIYVDGIKEDDASETFTGNGDPINIGRREYGGYYPGLIDEVRIYNYARTPAQIAWDYNRGKPIAYWDFDECEGEIIYDQSYQSKNTASSSHGTIIVGTGGTQTATGTCASSSPSFWYNGRNGKINGAGSFDGTDDYVNVGAGTNFNFGDSTNDSPFSIGLWTKFNDASEAAFFSKAVHTAGVDYKQYHFYTDDDDKLYIVTWDESSDGRIGRYYNTAMTSYEGQWIYLTAIYDGSALASGFSIYLNGQRIDNADYSSGSYTAMEDVSIDACIGRSYDFTSVPPMPFYSNGLVDEVKIWNYALTAEQIKTEHNSGAVRFSE